LAHYLNGVVGLHPPLVLFAEDCIQILTLGQGKVGGIFLYLVRYASGTYPEGTVEYTGGGYRSARWYELGDKGKDLEVQRYNCWFYLCVVGSFEDIVRV